MPPGEWIVAEEFQPKPSEYGYNLGRALTSVARHPALARPRVSDRGP